MKFLYPFTFVVIGLFCNVDGARDNKCLLSIDKGPCLANFPMYAYDASKRKCVEFKYGGCEGNDNKFNTMGECADECIWKSSRE